MEKVALLSVLTCNSRIIETPPPISCGVPHGSISGLFLLLTTLIFRTNLSKHFLNINICKYIDLSLLMSKTISKECVFCFVFFFVVVVLNFL